MRAVIVLAELLLAVPASTATRSGAPVELSNQGRALWNFEALLRDTYGSRRVCTRNGSLDFVASGCTPLATWRPYFYVFRSAGRSAFHATTRRPSGSFGAHPVSPVRLSGKFVVCGPRERAFLINHSDAAGFSLECAAPLP